MNKNITAVTLAAIMVLTMFSALVPAVSAVTEEVDAPYEFFALVNDSIKTVNTTWKLTSATHPSVLYYDFDEGDGNESLYFVIDHSKLEISGADDSKNFVYNTTIYYKDDDPKKEEPYIAWIGEPYYVVESGSDWYLSKLLVDDDDDETHMLKTGEGMTLPEGYVVTPVEIDVDGHEAWFTVTKDGEEVESLVVEQGDVFEYETDLNESGKDDNWVLRFGVQTVFAGMNTNLVKINKTQMISSDVLKIETPDDDTISDMEIKSVNRQFNDDTLEIKIDNNDDEIKLKKDGIVSFLGDRFNFRINEEGDVGGIVVKITEPGIYELFAKVQKGINVNDTTWDLTSATHPSILYYDFDEGDGNESLHFVVNSSKLEISGTGGSKNFVYNTTIYNRDNDPNEPYIAWLGEPYYVVENGSDWYLSKLLVDDEEDDTKMLKTGEGLTLPEGYVVTPVEIDVDGKEAWFTVTKDGEEVESLVVEQGDLFEYETDLNESGKDDNWVLRFGVQTVFAGMNTNLVKINKTQLISDDVLKVETPDDDTISDMEIKSENNYNTLEIRIDNDEDEIKLKKDGTVSFLNDRFNFKINEDGDVGGVLKIVKVGHFEPTPTPMGPNETAIGTPGPTGTVPAEGTPGATPPPVATTAVPTPTETKEEPGFEAFFAIAGLLAVAYLVLRKRE
jgi:S-layer protein (TIGR01567 family)